MLLLPLVRLANRAYAVSAGRDTVKLSSKSAGAQADADGQEDAALQLIRESPDLSLTKLVGKLKAAGIRRGETWVGEKRYEIHNTGVQHVRG